MPATKYTAMIFSLMVLTLIGTYIGKAVGLGFFVMGGVIIFLHHFTKRNNDLPNKSLRALAKNKIFVLSALTLLSFGWSSLNGIMPSYSLINWIPLPLIAICGAIWFTGLQRLGEDSLLSIPRYIFFGTLALASVFILETLVWKVTGYSPHGERFFLSMRKISSICSILLPFVFLHALHKEKALHWFLACICILPIFLCGGRSGIVAYTIMTVLFAATYPWATLAHIKRSFYAFWASPFIAATVGTLGYYWVAGEVRFTDRMSGADALSGAGRTNIWAYTFERFLENPFFGIGVQAFRHLNFGDVQLTSKMHPHNLPLEILIETGAIGFLLFFAAIIMILYRTIWQTRITTFYPAVRLRALVRAAFISLISYGVSSFFLTSFFHGWWLVYPLMIIAILAATSLVLLKKEHELRANFGAERTKNYNVAVSIIMPCHNGAAYVSAAIESVLKQTYSNWELLIVNDGSQDNSRTILESYKDKDARIHVFHNEAATGEGAARNLAIRHAQGRYIAFLDCDDIWHPDKLAIQIKTMEDNFLPLTYGYYDVIDETGAPTGRVCTGRNKITITHMLSSNDISCPTAVFDSAYFGKPEMPNKKRNTDMLYWISLLKTAHHATCIPHVLAGYRVHKSGISYNKIKMATSHWATFREDLALPLPMATYYFLYYCGRGLIKTYKARGSLALK